MEVPSSSSWVLPKEFVSMNDVRNGERPRGSFANVAGLVRDVQLPMQSKGDHFKMRIALIDKSLESNGSTLSFHIFAHLNEMPSVSLCDVVVVRNARVQQYNNEYSLILHNNTLVFVYPAETIPPISLKTLPPLRPCSLNVRNAVLARSVARLQETDGAYATRLFHAVDRTTFPDMQKFQNDVSRTLIVRNKDSKLDGLVAGWKGAPKFYDLLVSVVSISTRLGSASRESKVLIWVTDYTENVLFYDHPLPDSLTSPGAGATVQGQPGDKLGYMNNYNGKKNNKDEAKNYQWPGPFGRRCLLISCYEPHASYVRDNVRVKDWVRLRNVRVSMGSNEKNLEGFMADDVDKGSPVRVERIDMDGMGRKELGEWHWEALERGRRYLEHLKMLQRKSKKRKAAAMGAADDKRDREGKTAKNAKQRRREMRTREANGGGGGGSGSQQPKQEPKISISRNVVSEHTDQAVTPLATVLEPVLVKLPGGKEVAIPFVNRNFRAQVRVVDFLPERLQDFAVSRKTSQFDILNQAGGYESAAGAPSDASENDDDDDDDDNDNDNDDNDNDDSDGSNDSDDSDDSDDGTLNRFLGESVWEWRFALLLEDASGPPGSAPPRRLWAFVNNAAAQLLTGLDACNLRHDGKAFKALKAKMFLLWGELYERKEKAWAAARAAKDADAQRAAAAKKAEEDRKMAEALKAEREQKRLRQEEDKRRKEELRQKVAASRALLNYPEPGLNSDDEEAEDEEMAQAAPRGKAGEEKPEQAATEEGEGPDKKSKDAAMADAPVPVRQQPFACCLKQYGVQVRTAGAGKKRMTTWERKFALYGTQIRGAGCD